MKYFVKLIMEGEFPGSPDWDYVEINEQEYDFIKWLYNKRIRDTKEDADKIMQ